MMTMKKIIKAIRLFRPLMLLPVCGLLQATPLKAQSKVTLFQCYEWAYAHYPEAGKFGLIAEAGRLEAENAGRRWLPQLSVSGKASYQSDVTKLPFDEEQLSSLFPGISIPTMSRDQYQVVAEVYQSLWDGGAARSARSLAEATAGAGKEELSSRLYQLENQVNRLFFGCLMQKELLEQNRLLMQELEVNIERVANRMKNGLANASDKETLEVELLHAGQKRIELESAEAACRQLLALLVGRPEVERAELQAPAFNSGALSAEIQRPELQALAARERVVDVEEQHIHAALTPQLGVFFQGGYGRPGLNMLDDDFSPFYVAGIRLSWNIGRFYTFGNDKRRMRNRRESIALDRETFLFNTRMQLATYDRELQKFRKLMASDEEVIRLRSSIKRAAEVKMENGVIAAADLVREINAEDMARQAASIHRIQYLEALYNYMYTTNNHE